MKTILVGATVALATLFASGAAARDSDLQLLARDAGISDRQMRMLMGGSTGYAEYRTSYSRLREKLRRAEAAYYADEPAYVETREPVAVRRPAPPASERAAPVEAETYGIEEPN